MKHWKLTRGAYLVLILSSFLLLGACGSELSQQELLSRFEEAASPDEKREFGLAYLERFPTSENRQRVAQALFTTGVQAEDAELALRAAEVWLGSIEGESVRAGVLNRIAWSLATKGLAAETAAEYAEEAVDYARRTDSQRVYGYLDTLALARFESGESERAEQLQKEALEGYENDPDMLSRLALYQSTNGKNWEAVQTASEALLLGADRSTALSLRDWVHSLDESGDREQLRELVESRVGEYLEESDTPLRRSRAAVLMGITETRLAEALDWASEAYAESEREEIGGRVELLSNWAWVLLSQGRYAEALDRLRSVEGEVPLYSSDYWLTLGHAYRLADQREEALQAFLNPLVFQDSPDLRRQLEALRIGEAEIEERLAAKRADLLNFDPGERSTVSEETGQVVLAELFTGAECNPCQAADYAFDLLAEYYPRDLLVILEHHLHIPQPDPMTNPYTEARYAVYGGDTGTPTAFFNGTEKVTGGGLEILKKNRFERYRETIESLRRGQPVVDLELEASLEGEAIDVLVRPSFRTARGIREADLYLALVEDSVDYIGGNGVAHHAFVVRSIAGGQPIDSTAEKIEFTFYVPEVESILGAYLDTFEQSPPERYEGFGGWEDRPIELDLEKLSIVAWLQEREGPRVLQSAYESIRGERESN